MSVEKPENAEEGEYLTSDQVVAELKVIKAAGGDPLTSAIFQRWTRERLASAVKAGKSGSAERLLKYAQADVLALAGFSAEAKAILDKAFTSYTDQENTAAYKSLARTMGDLSVEKAAMKPIQYHIKEIEDNKKKEK